MNYRWVNTKRFIPSHQIYGWTADEILTEATAWLRVEQDKRTDRYVAVLWKVDHPITLEKLVFSPYQRFEAYEYGADAQQRLLEWAENMVMSPMDLLVSNLL